MYRNWPENQFSHLAMIVRETGIGNPGFFVDIDEMISDHENYRGNYITFLCVRAFHKKAVST